MYGLSIPSLPSFFCVWLNMKPGASYFLFAIGLKEQSAEPAVVAHASKCSTQEAKAGDL